MFVELLLHGLLRIGIEPEDRRQIRLARLEQHQPVGFRAGQRLFVRKDLPAEFFQPQLAEESLAKIRLPFPVEFLVIDVERVFMLLQQHAVGPPVLPEIGGPLVAGVGIGVARLRPVEFQPDDVARMLFVERVLQVRRRSRHTADRRRPTDRPPAPDRTASRAADSHQP